MTLEKINELASRKIAENKKNLDISNAPTPVPINFSVKIHELIASAESDPASASRLLQMAAEQLRIGAPPHPMIASYLANALEAAVAQPIGSQARELTNKFHLTNPNRRPARSWVLIGHAFHELVMDGFSKYKAKLEIAVEFDIDEATALKYYQLYVEAKILHDSID